jgi:flavin reductase (DIM6/NTAB) family NADH-FMN oxidoreductase RutF/DNA-binding IclR family transcriptional regulator
MTDTASRKPETQPDETSLIDPAVFRDVLGHYPTGVVVVTGRTGDGELLSMVVGTFNAVSLDPPLVAFLPMTGSRTFQALRTCNSLCINVLTGEQESVGRTIASRWENKLDGIDWFPSPSGDPILADSLAWLDVRLSETIQAGDHLIALCRVLDLGVNNPVNPLLFFQGGYGSFAVPSLVARIDAEIIGAVKQAAAVRPELEALASSLNAECCLITRANRDELVAVASATAAGLKAAEGLGERMPFVPPLGDSLIFDAPEDERAYWLDKASHASEEQQQIYRDRLAHITEHGYLLSFLPSDDSDAYTDVHNAAHEYAKGRLTPRQEREIRQRIQSSSVDYRVREIDDNQTYNIGSLVVPVISAEGGSPMTLRVAQLPPRAHGEDVRGWVEQTRASAAKISARLLDCGH